MAADIEAGGTAAAAEAASVESVTVVSAAADVAAVAGCFSGLASLEYLSLGWYCW